MDSLPRFGRPPKPPPSLLPRSCSLSLSSHLSLPFETPHCLPETLSLSLYFGKTLQPHEFIGLVRRECFDTFLRQRSQQAGTSLLQGLFVQLDSPKKANEPYLLHYTTHGNHLTLEVDANSRVAKSISSGDYSYGIAFQVMYDASGVRLHAGRQAELLNQIVCELPPEHPLSTVRPLQEPLGLTPLQVAASAVLGFFISFLMRESTPSQS